MPEAWPCLRSIAGWKDFGGNPRASTWRIFKQREQIDGNWGRGTASKSFITKKGDFVPDVVAREIEQVDLVKMFGPVEPEDIL